MAFLHTKQSTSQGFNKRLLHQLECKICPLANIKENKHPDIPPDGSLHPDVYLLGLGPGKDEDEAGQFWVGRAGQILRGAFSDYQWSTTRRNNVTRTRDLNDKPPQEAVECCRPSVERDIVLTKPRAIFGFGEYPIQWTSGESSPVLQWRGYHYPVNIAGHVCWFFPMAHPAFIARSPQYTHTFKLDIKNAYKFISRNITPVVHNPENAFTNVKCLYKIPEIEAALRQLAADPEGITIDLETTYPPRPYAPNSKILSISAGNSKWAIAFGWKHRQVKWTAEEFAYLAKIFFEIVLISGVIKKAHNKAFELEWLLFEYVKLYGFETAVRLVRDHWHDTMAKASALGYGGREKSGGGADDDETETQVMRGQLALDRQVFIYFGFKLKELSRLNKKDLDNEFLEDVLQYNAGDSLWTAALDLEQSKDLDADPKLWNVYNDLNRAIPTIVFTQQKGLYPDQELAKTLSKKYEDKLTTLFTDFNNNPDVINFKSKGHSFNPLAGDDAVDFFKGLNFPVTKIVKRGKVEVEVDSADAEILKTINHPIAKTIQQIRETNKLKTIYVDIFVPELNGKPNSKCLIYPDGLIHPTFTTMLTSTFRLSAKSPNVQNFPKRKNKEVREILKPPPGYKLVSIDYGQIEFRGMQMVFRDKNLGKYIWEGHDIHADWVWKIDKKFPKRFGGPEALANKTIFKAARDVAKNRFVFAGFFGASAKSLSGYLNIPLEIGTELYSDLWTEFSGVKLCHETLYNFYREHGYVESLGGKRRHAYIEGGEIINMPIQCSAFEIVMDGFNRLSEYAQESGEWWYQPVLQIHDDLEFWFPLDTWEACTDKAIEIMLHCEFPWINVPLSVETAVGEDWYHLQEIRVDNNAEWLKEQIKLREAA